MRYSTTFADRARHALLKATEDQLDAFARLVNEITPETEPLPFNYYQRCVDQRDALRAALVQLVGVDGRSDLEQLECVMRLMSAPAADKAATIDAIHALIETLPAKSEGMTPSVITPTE